jgi:hypothetical protein
MLLAFQLALLAFAVILPIYWHAFYRFYGLVKAEKPEWLNIRGAFSFLYDDGTLPRVGDPNITIELLRVAFGARVRQMHSPKAAAYARRIRLLTCGGLGLFITGITGLLASAR